MRPWHFVFLLTACEVANPAYDVTARRNADADGKSDATPAPDDADAAPGGAGAAPGGAGGGTGGGGAPVGGSDAGGRGGDPTLRPDAAIDAGILATPDAAVDAPRPTTGPILEFRFNEGSGTKVGDTSGFGNHGLAKCVFGCSNGLPNWIGYDSIFGMELAYFQLIQVESSPSLSAATGDFSLFVHARRLDHAGMRPLASSLTNDKTSTLFLFSFDDGHLSARVANVRVSDPQTAPGNTWMHLGVRRQGGTLAIFRDGQMVASAGPSTQAPLGTQPLLIGAAFLNQASTNHTYADAVVDDLVFYNRALTNSEVDKLRQGIIPR
ncbi:MAG: LamG-like jellyroll fold domain-containing protein [Deltaproteobacteria bacterium]|nr:LamG-like jellyroll fold domain-containing protein [Deltaproteobacteria bacterium]